MEPTTPNSTATEHVNDDNTGPRCHLCKGPGEVEARRENVGTVKICSMTFATRFCMFRETYAYSIQVCHNCYEGYPYSPQEELDLCARLRGDAQQIAAVLRAFFSAVNLPDNAAQKITDYAFTCDQSCAATEHTAIVAQELPPNASTLERLAAIAAML